LKLEFSTLPAEVVMEWLGQIGGIASIAALIGAVLSYMGSSCNSYAEEFKAVLGGLRELRS
jgi:hypothetical protein